MNATDVLNRRLSTQRVAGTPFDRPEDVVHWLVGVQSQDYPGARWSVGQRTRDCRDADVARAFDEGRILRTHVLRPTWHFVTPADIRILLQLTAPRVEALNAFIYRQQGLDTETLTRGEHVIAGALEGGNQLTRPELAAILGQEGIPATGVRLAYIVMHAELDALICSGAMRGKQHTYALLDERAPDARVVPHEKALAEITFRFFTGHGPATSRSTFAGPGSPSPMPGRASTWSSGIWSMRTWKARPIGSATHRKCPKRRESPPISCRNTTRPC